MNFKRYSLLNETGIRCLILKRNYFGEKFALDLSETLLIDNYIKKIDLAANFITTHGLNVLLKNTLVAGAIANGNLKKQ